MLFLMHLVWTASLSSIERMDLSVEGGTDLYRAQAEVINVVDQDSGIGRFENQISDCELEQPPSGFAEDYRILTDNQDCIIRIGTHVINYYLVMNPDDSKSERMKVFSVGLQDDNN